ncbi:hypothetical protein BRADI_2g05246v3 [Brachypodium distachyon]|uniref:Uncharacterized protein n=1 Tax=Brachypodium distachyon TaxID=15368 RepID=A0A2K2D738_BRADI|nr:hypothetical protein BRADI_2g05246v3 [Brachypodium distachyon]
MVLPDELFEEDPPPPPAGRAGVPPPRLHRLQAMAAPPIRPQNPPPPPYTPRETLLLGFLHNLFENRIPGFIPTTASAFPLVVPDQRDCRHGHALLFAQGNRGNHLLVWDPITGYQWCVLAPTCSRAVRERGRGLCSGQRLPRGPFRVVFMFPHGITPISAAAQVLVPHGQQPEALAGEG